MKAIAFSSLALLFASSCGGPEWEFVYEHDPQLSVQALSCGSDSFVLAGSATPPIDELMKLPGHPLDHRWPSLIYHDAVTTQETIPTGGWVWSLSRPAPLVLFATTIDTSTPKLRTSRLFRSIDGGRAWTNLLFPTQDAFGVAFATADIGFAWTDREAFHSKDGGQSWDPIPGIREAVGSRRIPRQHPSPIVTADGELFLPLTTLGADGYVAHALLRVGPDLRMSVIDPPVTELLEIAGGDSGSIWALGRDSRDGAIKHFEVGREASRPTKHDFDGSWVRALLLHGQTQVVIVSRPDGFWTDDAMYFSTDGGRSWSKGWLPARPVKAACFAPTGELLLATTPGVWRGVPQSRGSAHSFKPGERWLYRPGG